MKSKSKHIERALFLIFPYALENNNTNQSWKNYSKLQGMPRDKRHCHLSKGRPTCVGCWEVIDKNMPALTKKHPTDDVAKISWHGGLYAVPIEVMERYKVTSDDKHISIDDLFSDLTQESGEPGVLLKGLRYREGLS